MSVIEGWFKENTLLYDFIFTLLSRQNNEINRQRNFIAGDIRRDNYATLRESYVDSDSNWALTHKYLLLTRTCWKNMGSIFR